MRLGLRGKDFPSIKNWLNESKTSVRNFPGSIASIANRCRDCAPASFSIKEDSAEYWSVSQLRDGMVFTPAKWRRLRHFAGVKTIPSLSCDTLQYSAESSLIEKLAGAQSLQRLAIDAIDPGKFRTEVFDSFSQFLMDGKSFPRKPNRIRRNRTQLLGSIALVQFEPAVD